MASKSFLPLAFSVPMIPIGKQRPRVTRNGTYMDPKYRAWQRQFLWFVRNQLPPGFELINKDTPLALCALIFSETGRIKSDIDNAAGTVMDALQGIVYANDRRIASLYIACRVGEPRVDFSLSLYEEAAEHGIAA